MTKMTAMLKNAQNFKKNLLLQNHRVNFFETWYVASGSVVLHSLYKSWPWVDLDLFYCKVNFGSLGIWMENKWFFFYFFLFLLYSKVKKWSKVNLLWMLEVKDILWPWPRSFELKNFDKNLDTFFSKTTRLNENISYEDNMRWKK